MRRSIFLLGVALCLAATSAARAASSEETLFQQRCGTCHSLEAKDAKMGPPLRTVVGRKTGSVPGYAYSDGMKNAGFTWDAARLDAFLAAPTKAVPGTKMMIRLTDAEPRAAIVRYLVSLNPKPARKGK